MRYIFWWICLGAKAFAYEASRITFERVHTTKLTSFYVLFYSGSLYEEEEDLGIVNFLGEMMLRGTKSRTKEQLNKLLDKLGSQINVSVDKEGLFFECKCLFSELPEFLKILKDILLNPSFPEKEIKKLKKEINAQILQQLENDPVLGTKKFFSWLFAGHPFGNPVLGTRNTVKNFTQGKILKYYNQLLTADRFEIIGYGKMQKENILENFSRELQAGFSNTTASVARYIFPPQLPSKKQVILVNKPGRTQAHVFMGQVGLSALHPLYPALDLFTTALGGSGLSSILMEELRHKRGYTYGVHSYLRLSRIPKAWFIYQFPANAFLLDSLQVTFNLLKELQQKGLTQEQFDFVKESQINSSIFNYETPLLRAHNLLVEKMQGLENNFIRSYAEKLKLVTLSQANEAFRQFFQPDKMTILVLGDGKHLQPVLQKAVGTEITVVPYREE